MIDRRTLLTAAGTTMTALVAGQASAGLSTGKSKMSDSESYVDVVGGRLHYLSAGEGETLLLLHKLGGRVQEWRRMVPALARKYRVISLDLAGHGKSQMHGEPPFVVTQESMAAQVMAAMDALELAAPYRFVGSSLGGCVAIVSAALWPKRVAGVVTVGSALGGSVSRKELRDGAAKFIADGYFDTEENPIPRDVSYARRVFGVQDDTIAHEQNESRTEAGRWIQPCTRGVGRFDYLALMPTVTTPVLLSWGKRGNYGQYVDAALAQLPNGQKLEIEDSGSFPHEESPEETAAAVLDFLK